MGRLRGGGVYGVNDVAAAIGVDARLVADLIRGGETRWLVWRVQARRLAERRAAQKVDISAFIRSATEIST